MSFTSKVVSNKSEMDFLMSYLSLAPLPLLKRPVAVDFLEF
jgi:hypothetical protein